MSNTFALNHALRLHAFGVDRETIRSYLRPYANRHERNEIIAALDRPEASLVGHVRQAGVKFGMAIQGHRSGGLCGDA